MNTNNLPPELVEKMRKICTRNLPYASAEQCAQIAVDYQLEESDRLIKTLEDATELILSLEQQRDELLEALRHIERICNGEIPEHEVFWHISREQTIKYEGD